ncbi:Ig-like domain-containing protein, partial [Olsenella sp. DSM 107455]
MSEGREGRNLKRREAMKKWKAVLAVFLSVVLVLQSSNIQALADVIVGDGESGREEIVLDKPAEETEPSESTDEQKDTPPVSEPKEAEEPAEPTEPATPEEPTEQKDEPAEKTEPVEKAEETKPVETTEPSKETSNSTADEQSSPETEDTTATLKFDVTGATLTYNQDGEKNVTADTADKTAKVETTQDFKFTVTPDDGQQIASVKAVTSDSAESDVAANDSGVYTLAAANVTDGTTIKVTTEAVPEAETPVEEETTETDTTVTDETTVEDEETAPETTPNSVQSVDNSISLMAATGNGILDGSGTEWDPYEVTAGSSVTITEDYKSDRAKWSISDGTQYGRLSNTSIGSEGRWTWDGYQEGEDARATLTINDGVRVGAEITVRFGYSGAWTGNNYEYTYFEVVAEPVAATGIEVTIEKDTITSGDSTQAHATLTPSDANEKVTWSSSDTSVATVDQSGRVTGKGFGGTATITARTASGLSGSVRITVRRNTSGDVRQKAYFYLVYPGVTPGEGAAYQAGDWLYGGEGVIIAPRASAELNGTIISAGLSSMIEDAGDYYKDKTITVNGKTYKFDTEGTGADGTFSIVWDKAIVAAGSNNSHKWDGENGQVVYLTNTHDWHVDGRLVLHDTKYVNAAFYVKDPGQSGIQLVDGGLGSQLVEIGKDVQVPDMSETKEYGGVTFTFDGWYKSYNRETGEMSDKATAADFKNLQADVTFYAKYVTEVTYTYSATKGGSVTRPSESLDPESGTAQGSTAGDPQKGYAFDGWYVGNVKITESNAAQYNVKLSNDGKTLTPQKNDSNIYEGGTFQARYTQVKFDGSTITIVVYKNGEQISVDGNIEPSKWGDRTEDIIFTPTEDGLSYTVDYVYEERDCADFLLGVNVPDGYTAKITAPQAGATTGDAEFSAKDTSDGAGKSWELDNVPGGSEVRVDLTPNTDTKYTVEYYYQVDGQYPVSADDSVTRGGTTDTACAVTDG